MPQVRMLLAQMLLQLVLPGVAPEALTPTLATSCDIAEMEDLIYSVNRCLAADTVCVPRESPGAARLLAHNLSWGRYRCWCRRRKVLHALVRYVGLWVCDEAVHLSWILHGVDVVG